MFRAAEALGTPAFQALPDSDNASGSEKRLRKSVGRSREHLETAVRGATESIPAKVHLSPSRRRPLDPIQKSDRRTTRCSRRTRAA